MTKLAHWFNQVEDTKLKQFTTVTKTFMLKLSVYTKLLQ